MLTIVTKSKEFPKRRKKKKKKKVRPNLKIIEIHYKRLERNDWIFPRFFEKEFHENSVGKQRIRKRPKFHSKGGIENSKNPIKIDSRIRLKNCENRRGPPEWPVVWYACYERDRIAKLVVGPRFETGRARIEPSDNGGALLEAFDDAKRVRPPVGARHGAREREREGETEGREGRDTPGRCSLALVGHFRRYWHGSRTQPRAQQNRTESSSPLPHPSPLPARILLD